MFQTGRVWKVALRELPRPLISQNTVGGIPSGPERRFGTTCSPPPPPHPAIPFTCTVICAVHVRCDCFILVFPVPQESDYVRAIKGKDFFPFFFFFSHVKCTTINLPPHVEMHVPIFVHKILPALGSDVEQPCQPWVYTVYSQWSCATITRDHGPVKSEYKSK